MTQISIDFDGATYDKGYDGTRLNRQLQIVFDVMKDGEWRTPGLIELLTHVNWASANARLRDFRKVRFGGYTVERRRVPGAEARGLFEYRLLVNRARP